MSTNSNSIFKHYCECCGKELSPILVDLKIVRIDKYLYNICEECFEIGCKNGAIDTSIDE